MLENLQGALEKIFDEFSTNHLVANAGKCHRLTSSKTPVKIHISNTDVLNKLPGVNLEGKLNFDFHVNTLLRKAGKRYHVLATVCNYMNKKKRRILKNAFITSQSSYCPLVWMSHSGTMNNRINKIHEKALRRVNKDEKKSFVGWFAQKGQMNKYSPKKSTNLGDRNL